MGEFLSTSKMRFHGLVGFALIVLLSTIAVFGTPDFTGTITINGKTFTSPHVYALLHDNAEGLLAQPTQLRILVTDREVPLEAMYGLHFLPVGDLAGRGEVEGVLLQFDPAKPGDVDYTVLTVKGVQTVTTKVTIKDLTVKAGRVTGTFDFHDRSFANFPDYPKVDFSFTIDMALNLYPTVTLDLKGPEARNSPHLKAVKLIADAMAAGNVGALEKLLSVRAARRNKEELERRGKGGTAIYKRVGRDVMRLLPRVKRVVVRGDRAVVLFPEDTTFELILEGGVWKGN